MSGIMTYPVTGIAHLALFTTKAIEIAICAAAMC